MSKKSLRRRNDDTEELDVFEAAKYFSDSNEVSTSTHKNHLNGRAWGGGGRRSLDITMQMRRSLQGKKSWVVGDVELLDKKQPSSPGGKLASFLNSLFNQTRKKWKAGKEDHEDDDERPGGGRSSRRRWLGVKNPRPSSSSSTTTTTTTTGTNLSSGCGFRTPPPTYTYAPTKSYILSNLHSEQVTNGPKNHKSISCFVKNAFRSNSTRKEKHLGEIRTKMNNEDDEDDDDYSDTSSDLFDLPSSELMKGLYSSSGLPVYQTTQMDCIKKGNDNAPI
ncbi:hypothetical protein DM860_002303 [Cuscuta australis]|uniref:Protein BIG GRAIN 1-like E n=1 Tax=Cuscuta australis TaxID=267555 RepID=A0A328CXX6_9ASTE|nr:hypothetical protein DM860_002303 [Cuscuta australis]